MYAHVEVPTGTATELRQALAAQTQDRVGLRTLCVPKTSNPTIVVMKSAQDGA
jgi:hypothetical protein